MDALKDILEELGQTGARHGYSDAANKIIANIKSTMSDRASSQKAFNTLLSEYRTNVLPLIIDNWESLGENEQASMSQMFHYFCGMHLLVNMAENVTEALKLFENANGTSDNESGTVRLVRTTCKAFQRRACEKSGCPLQFTSYLKQQGFDSNPLINFRGNRYNVLFANGGRVYQLSEHIINFLKKVWGTPNRLLQAVLNDAESNLNMAGCKALGLIDKHITGPLWRLMESSTHILDVPKYYKVLHTFVQNDDVSGFMTGENVPFPTMRIKKDDLWVALTLPSPHDPLVEQMLQACFRSIQLLLERVLEDFHPAEEADRSQTLTVKNTNTVSERDFAKLDRLIREKLHSTILALEAHILFSNNKTSSWFAQQSPEIQKELMETARRMGHKHKKKFQERLAVIHQKRTDLLKMREEARHASEQRILLQKEKITSDMVQHGLWQSIEDIEKHLTQLKSENQKKEALKVQLRFRKTVLQQVYPANKDVYKFSKKGEGQFNSTKLASHLTELINATCHTSPPDISCNFTSEPALVGKSIDHQFIEDDQIVQYSGRVVSQVAGFPEWYNVVYENEPDVVYTYKLMEDFYNGDLKLI